MVDLVYKHAPILDLCMSLRACLFWTPTLVVGGVNPANPITTRLVVAPRPIVVRRFALAKRPNRRTRHPAGRYEALVYTPQ